MGVIGAKVNADCTSILMMRLTAAIGTEKLTFTCASPKSTDASHSHGPGASGPGASSEGSVDLLQQLPWESDAVSAEGIDSARQMQTGLAKIKPNPATIIACQQAFTRGNLASSLEKSTWAWQKHEQFSSLMLQAR
ncbi:MAG: hypothetical protein H8E27_07615 [Verrucomicrobia subdivision 3 bacterium]|nr:hypothetical protein [Limisphaerales bacterium]